MSHNQKIPPQLIIYKASRFSKLRQSDLKHLCIPSKLEDSSNLPPRYFPKKRYTKISTRFLYTPILEISNAMRFITKFRDSIRHLSVILPSKNFDTPDSELLARKTLKKLLKICSKIKSFDLRVFASSCVEIQLSWRFLRLIKLFKNFSCTLSSPSETHFENLATTLVKTQRKSSKQTNSFRFLIQSGSHTKMDSFFDWISFANSFETLNSKLKNSNFSLQISFDPRVEGQDFFEFAQRCLGFPSLRELSTNFDLFDLKRSFKLLSLIQESQDLKKLTLKLTDSSIYGSHSSSLPQHIEPLTFKSLAHLHLNLEEIRDPQFLTSFFQALALCNTQLSSLGIEPGSASDSVIECFTQSLHKFDKLSSLTLKADRHYRFENRLASPTIRAFYEKLSVLKQLNKLNLDFRKQTGIGSADVFSAFCESLGNLTELKSLELYMNSTVFGASCLVQLANTLPDLESLVLNCNGSTNEKISGNILNQFVMNLVDLRNLSRLDLNILCKDVDDQCSKEIVASFWQLKSLNSLCFCLNVRDCDASVNQYITEQMHKLGNRIDVSLAIWPVY